MGRIKELESKWQSSRASPADTGETVKHVITCSELMAELYVIFELTGEPIFLEARKIIGNSDLTERGHWKRNQVPADYIPYPCPGRSVHRLMKQGKSEREACALVAVQNHVAAASFDAAIAQVRRAWKRYQSESLTIGSEQKSKV